MGSGLWSERLQLYTFYYLKSSRPYSEKRQENKGSSKRKSRGENMIGVGKIKQYSNVLDKPLSKGKQEVLFESLFSFFLSFNFFVSYSVWLPRKCAGKSKATEFHLKLKFFVPQLLSQHFFSWQRQVKIRSWQQIMTLFFL